MASQTATKSPPKKSRSQQLRQILEAVTGEIEPVEVTSGYRWATVFVAATMLLLPLIYAGIVFLTAYGVYWHFTRNMRWIGANVFGAFFYLLILAVGIIITLFLVKPILARGGPQQRPQRLKREAEPFLYDYVEAIARTVNAPSPTSIRVDCQPNASAGFRRGLWSLFTDDMVLTIGLPFVAGLSLRQLSGVLAHELGHFAQRGGMRLGYLNARVFHWFERVTFERDGWDLWLWRHSVEGNGAKRGFFYVARFFVWLSRWAMYGLWLGAYAISHNLSRQQEFDADRYEARLIGPAIFESTTKRLPELAIGFHWAIEQLPTFWDEGRLPDDLPSMIVANIKYLTPENRRELRKSINEHKTGWLDSHPSDPERIASARAERTRGIFQLPGDREDLPATVIFRDFHALSKVLTRKLYKEGYGLRLKRNQLRPVKELIARLDAEREAGEALFRYFQVRIPVLFPLPIDPSATRPPEDAKALRDAMKQSRQQMLDEVEDYKEAAKRYRKVEEKLFDTAGALALLDLNIPVRASEFNLKRGSYKEADSKNRRANEALSRLAGQMLPFETAAGHRLSSALQLLQDDRVAGRIEGGDKLQTEVAELIPEAIFVSELMDDMRRFRVFHHKVAVLCSQLERHHHNPDLIYAILGQLERFHQRLEDVQHRLADRLYPFDHARADTTLQEYALPELPEENDVGGIMGATEYLVDQLVKVQIRLFARLAVAAEKVEDAFNLERLPQPKDEEEEENEDE